MFREHGSKDWFESFNAIEPLFALLIRVSAVVSKSPFFFTAFVSIVQGLILVKLINTSKRPATFLLVFIAAFYCDFEFNVLRAGTAIMLLVLASRYVDCVQKRSFYSYGVAAVLTHYTAIIGLLLLVYIKERNALARMFVSALALIASWLILNYLIDSARLGVLIFYASEIERDEGLKVGVGFYALQVLYMLLFLSVVNRVNWTSRTILFLSWLIMMWAGLTFGYVDRLKVMISALFLFLSIESNLVGWKKDVHYIALVGIAMLSLFGGLKTMEESSASTDVGFNQLASPFVPYRVFWAEIPR